MDEVPTRAQDFVVSLSIAFDSDLTANLSLALTRGAGECPLSVGSRCPRRKFRRRGSARRGTPPSSPHKVSRAHIPGGDASLAGVREGKHSPAIRQSSNASLAGF